MKYFLSIVFLIIWIIFFTGFNDLYLTNSDYVRYGGESEAFLMGIVQTLLYGVGFLPLVFFIINEKKNLQVKNNNNIDAINGEKENAIENAKEIVSKHYNISTVQLENSLSYNKYKPKHPFLKKESKTSSSLAIPLLIACIIISIVSFFFKEKLDLIFGVGFANFIINGSILISFVMILFIIFRFILNKEI